ncbi:mitochondrial mRNA pseudouridine synthase RPUSD3 isoform X4 [Elephas maximus indicus]|uniref:mitochondrial mRNA pseudouridine synthase RPUSD3 isoform X4 n=1 Tax=Elephas maximus indicus TaxID=99487 RepID=UPI002116661D|nr:mitochondrial mRNA pseudouridine synthase RPUSD3 isoform X4 [Elephas maximus indicus]
MVGCCIWGRSWVGWRRGPGVRAALAAAGFGTKAGHQLQPQGSSKRSGPRRDQPCPGLLRPEDLSREELVDVLTAAVVDQKGPLVTVNKPQGLPVTGKPGDLTLLSVLPELSQSLGLGERELQIVRAPGKDSSGLVLLSSCPQTASRLQKFFTHSCRVQRPTATYCAITDGIPATSEGKIQAALKLEHIDGANLVTYLFWGAGIAGSSSEASFPEGHPGRCQKDSQPLPCGGHRLRLCAGPAAAIDSVPQSATGAHGSAALPCAWGSHVLCPCQHCPGPALSAAS